MIRYNGYVIGKGGYWLKAGQGPGPALPPFTIRLKFTEGVTPTFSNGTAVQVSSSPNIWDLTYVNNNWYRLLASQTDLIEVLDANTTGVTGMPGMFLNCSNLVNVALFDTTSTTNISEMFFYCRSLKSLPLYDTSNVTNMYDLCLHCESLLYVPLLDTSSCNNVGNMFNSCHNVRSGALALYQQMSTQANPPASHGNAFYNCGRDTVTGAAELALIPDDWK